MEKIKTVLTFLIIIIFGIYVWSLLYGLLIYEHTATRIKTTQAQQTGTLHVIISPQGAIDDGTQWRLDGGNWRDSGGYATVEVGSHTVEFKETTGWYKPSDQTANITENQTTDVTGTYTRISDLIYTRISVLKVTITPQSAIDAGAKWNVDGGAWQNSGAIVYGLTAGEHTVSYKETTGWTAPSDQSAAVSEGQITGIAGAYTQQFGSLKVTTTPQGAKVAGANWRVDGGSWQESGSTVLGLSLGNHTISYRTVLGWVAPYEDIVSIQADKTTGVTAIYSERSGSTIRVPKDYINIQAGIDAASDGDTVLIADGIYYGTGNKNLDFGGKAIKVVSENGPENSIIDCEKNGRGFYFHSGEGEDSVISGLTVRNGKVDHYGGGIYCDSSSPTITNCTISDNTVGGLPDSGYGGGIYLTSSSPIITNCTISDNSQGGGIYCASSSPTITNCTITGNTAVANGGGIFCTVSSPIIRNSILWGNSPQELSGKLSVTYSDIEGGYSGTGNINSNPLFVSGSDYHLTASSPCFNAGDNNAPALPSIDKDGNSRIIGGIVDMGAYEYQIVAYVNKDDDTCGGKTPCYTTIQEAINTSSDGTLIRVVEGNYEENIALNASKTLTLKGGYDSAFTAQASNTNINSLTIAENSGTVEIENIILQ